MNERDTFGRIDPKDIRDGEPLGIAQRLATSMMFDHRVFTTCAVVGTYRTVSGRVLPASATLAADGKEQDCAELAKLLRNMADEIEKLDWSTAQKVVQ